MPPESSNPQRPLSVRLGSYRFGGADYSHVTVDEFGDDDFLTSEFDAIFGEPRPVMNNGSVSNGFVTNPGTITLESVRELYRNAFRHAPASQDLSSTFTLQRIRYYRDGQVYRQEQDFEKVSRDPTRIYKWRSFWIDRYSRGEVRDLSQIVGMSEDDIDFIRHHWLMGRFPEIPFYLSVFYGIDKYLDFVIDCVRNIPGLNIGVVPINGALTRRLRSKVFDRFDLSEIQHASISRLVLHDNTQIDLITSNYDIQGRIFDMILVEEPGEQ